MTFRCGGWRSRSSHHHICVDIHNAAKHEWQTGSYSYQDEEVGDDEGPRSITVTRSAPDEIGRRDKILVGFSGTSARPSACRSPEK